MYPSIHLDSIKGGQADLRIHISLSVMIAEIGTPSMANLFELILAVSSSFVSG